MDSKCFLKVELSGPNDRLYEDGGVSGKKEKVPKNNSEVSGFKAWD